MSSQGGTTFAAALGCGWDAAAGGVGVSRRGVGTGTCTAGLLAGFGAAGFVAAGAFAETADPPRAPRSDDNFMPALRSTSSAALAPLLALDTAELAGCASVKFCV
jgi:hypothetical protein